MLSKGPKNGSAEISRGLVTVCSGHAGLWSPSQRSCGSLHQSTHPDEDRGPWYQPRTFWGCTLKTCSDVLAVVGVTDHGCQGTVPARAVDTR